MAASTYETQNNILNAVLRGVPLPVPSSKTYVALHTENPTKAGLHEVTTVQWPAYVRREAEQGGALGTGWSEATGTAGESKNANQITYPSYDGIADLEITHWSIYYESTGGTMRVFAPLQTPRLLKTGDVFVFDVNTLTVTQG